MPHFTVSTDEGACSDDRSEDVVLKKQVTEAMDEFGERLITLGENAWKIQKEAIEKSSWFKGSKTERETKTSTADGFAGL